MKHGNEQGFALIVTLWIILALSTTAIYFSHAVVLEKRTIAQAVSSMQAEVALRGAQTYVEAVLGAGSKGTCPDADEMLCEDVAIGATRFWILGRPVGEPTDDALSFGLIDEAGKLNLNTATEDMLLHLPGMTAEVAAAIVDWRDQDGEPLAQGAEGETYSRLEPSYQAKNAPFESVEELRLVYGVDLDLLFGADTNLNGLVETNDEARHGTILGIQGTAPTGMGWLDFLTVWSREPNQQTDGSERINVNDRDSGSLLELLQRELTADIATQVVARTRPGQRQYDSLLAFFLASELTADQFAGIADALTVVEGDYMEGLVNVNAASATVLACLPGMDEQAAERVVSYRTIHAESEDFRSVAWLAEVLSQDQAMGIGPHVTTKTYQCSADIVAVGEGNRGCQRVFLVFDTSGEEVRTVYHRSRSALGWALGDDLREAMRP